jgi:response regulator RpfG family c-di-GMP phosphodiesterase
MSEKILVVDDDRNLLDGIRRQLHGKMNISVAESGMEGLELIKKNGPFAVVVSDYKMPLMNGVEFLSRVRDISPDTVRIMLTGQADMQAIIDVINQGEIFRFLTKPCPPDLLKKNIEDGIHQYRLINAEKELLGKTLSGSIKLLNDILALAKPEAFSRSLRVRHIARQIAEKMGLDTLWQIEIAAMLSQIGCITIPNSILSKVYRNMRLLPDEILMFENHPRTGNEMLANIPRLEQVAEIVLYQDKYFDGSGFPRDKISGEDIPLGARILKVALDFDKLLQSGMEMGEAIEEMKKRMRWYDYQIVQKLDKTISRDSKKKNLYTVKELKIDQLNDTMLIAEELVSASGLVLGSKNQRLTKSMIIALKNYCKNKEIKESITVVVPVA